MKISGRNFIAGKITDVHKGSTTAHVSIEVAPGIILLASITNESVDELKLEKGMTAHALIKSSDVMIAVD